MATLRIVVTQGGRAVSSLTFARAAVTIGAAPTSDVILADPCVSWHHATLHVSGSHLVIVDAGSTNGSFVNGVRVGRADLGAGGHVFIHPYDLAIELELDAAGEEPPSPEARADGALASGRLTVVNGPGSLTSRSFLLPASRRLIIGRSADSDISLRDPTVSREHAELQSNGNGRWTIRDLGSRNGIAVNGRVTASAELSDGDRIDIGPLISLIFSVGLVSDHERPATRHFRRPAAPAQSAPLNPAALPAAPRPAAPAPPPAPAGAAPAGGTPVVGEPVELLLEFPDPPALEPPTAVARPRLMLATSRAPNDSRIAVIEVEGAVDAETGPELEQSLWQAVGAGERFLVIDLAGCNRLDHAGLGVLVVARSRLRRMGGEVRVCGAAQRLTDPLGLGGDDELLKLGGDRETAIEDVRRELSQF